jgi:hypothetical protein
LFLASQKSSFLEAEESKAVNHVDLQNTREQADFALRPSGRQESRPNLTVSAHRSAV